MPDEKPFGEFELIRRLTADLPTRESVIIGPGDDAAVVRPSEGMDLVITTDSFVAGRHYRPRAGLIGDEARGHAIEIGMRLALANLSDFAAMAALPRWAVLSIGTSGEDPEWLERVERSLGLALGQEQVAIVGGNLARADGAEWFSLTLVGEVERGRAWSRKGARPGDLIAVTGTPGLAGIGHAKGVSRVSAARALAKADAVRAAIDLSDGVHGDLGHLCEASSVGAEVQSEWPEDELSVFAAYRFALDDKAHRRPKQLIKSPEIAPLIEAMRFGPSDDYELLLAVDPEKRDVCERVARETDTPLTFVGRFTAERGVMTLRRPDGSVVPLPGRGYDHFASKE